MNKNMLMLLIILVALGGGALFWYWGQGGQTSMDDSVLTEDGQMAESITVTLNEQNDSGEYGTATLTEVGGQVMVSISMIGSPTGVSQPAHIHTGICPDVGGVVHSLEFPLNGGSETTLATTFEELRSGLPLAINIHKSVPEASVYTACGDLVF